MTDKAEALYSELMKLPDAERNALLGRALLALQAIEADAGTDESEEDVAAAWDEEVERRIDDLDSGRVQPISWEEARKRILSE
jgi:putative addiction module component (TIGR02574 family)